MEDNISSPTDPLLLQARNLVLTLQNPSAAFLQRYFKIGYNRAQGLMQCMEGDVVTAPYVNGWRRMQATGAMSADDPNYHRQSVISALQTPLFLTDAQDTSTDTSPKSNSPVSD